jgi:UDP-N-acetylglucosamine--dolichyl-phosphate N-acetylglucosaminephosphotransferase
MIFSSNLEWDLTTWIYLALIFGFGFITTAILIPFIIRFAKKKGHVGYDIHKNNHPEIAESGGLSMVIGACISSIFLIFFFPLYSNYIIVFIFIVISIGVIGFFDDRYKLRSLYKIILILILGFIIVLTNLFKFIEIKSPTIPFLGKLRMNLIYPLLAPIILAVFANSTNMLEGYNGEGSGTCLIANVFLLICSVILNSSLGILLGIITISTIIPFFWQNKYPAKVFPGDIGTLYMGASIFCIALFGSLEVPTFCVLMPHIFNSFYVLYSMKGFFESSEIQKSKNDIILLDGDQIMASDKKDAVLSLPRIILAKGPLSEPNLVKNIYAISIICGIFSINTSLIMLWAANTLGIEVIFISILVSFIVISLFFWSFSRIRGIAMLMILLLGCGATILIFIDTVIMKTFDQMINILFVQIPLNLIISFILITPGLLLWYYITRIYFSKQISLKE